MPGMFLIRLRTSGARWATVPLIALGLLILFQRNNYWVGIWPETGAATSTSAFFISLFASAVSAWSSARFTASLDRDMSESSTRNPLTIELLRILGNSLWLTLPYLIVAITAGLVTATAENAPGFLEYLAYVAMGSFTILLSMSWGWLIGRWLGPTLSALIAILSWFVLLSLLDGVTQLNPVSGPPWVSTNLTNALLRVGAAALFLLALALLPHRTFRQSQRATAGAVVTLAFALVVTSIATAPVLGRRAPVATPLCLSGEIEYCLWPEHKKYSSLVLAVDAEVTQLPLTLSLPDTVVDYSLSGSTRWNADGIEMELPGTFAPEFDISEGSRWALSRGVAAAITAKVFEECSLDSPEDPQLRREQLQAWLEIRLAGGGSPDYTTDAPAELQEAWQKGYAAAQHLSRNAQAGWAKSLIIEKKRGFCAAA